MNTEQVKSSLRWVIATFGGFFVSWAVMQGLPGDQILAFLNSEFFIGIAASVISLAWGLIARTRANTIIAATNDPAVPQIYINDPALAAQVKEKGDARVVLATK